MQDPIKSKPTESRKRKGNTTCSSLTVHNPIFPREIVATILEFAIDDLNTYKHCCLVCKSWYYGVLISPDSTKIWHGLVRRHYPVAESLATSLRSQRYMVNFPIIWKYEFMKQYFYSRPDTMYMNVTPDLVPPPISSYIFQIDIDCYLTNTSDENQHITKSRISCLVDGGKGATWDHDNLNIDLSDNVTDHLKAFDFRRFDISVHVIEKRSGLRALLFNGEPEDWIDNNLFFYGNFSPPRRLFAEFGICAFVYANRCECLCPAHEDEAFFRARSSPLFHSTCPCGECRESKQICSCCSCEEQWSCFHNYSLVVHPFSHYEDDLGTMPNTEFLRFLERGFGYL